MDLLEKILETQKAYVFGVIFLAVCLLVIAAIMLDLWDGVHTAIKIGEKLHSHRLRETMEKMSEYFRFILIGFLVDCLGLLFAFYPLPFVTILFGVGLIVVEAKSMFEHARKRRSHTMVLPEIIRAVIECSHEHDARRIVELISSKEEVKVEVGHGQA